MLNFFTVSMAMSIEQYPNQRCHRDCSFDPVGGVGGLKVAAEGRTISYFSLAAVLHIWQLH